jgi:hypothetical protein
MQNKMEKIVYWAPRVLGIIFILFLAMFSLDVFEEGKGLGQIASGLFMHNIPVFILAAILAVAWKREIVGAVAFITAGIFYIAMLLKSGFEWYMLSWILTISGPAFLTGGLFWIGWRKRKSNKKID